MNYQSQNVCLANSSLGLPMDCGCNRDIASNNIHNLWLLFYKVNITDIKDNQMTNLSIGTFADITMSNQGPLIFILYQYTYTGKDH